MRAQWDERYQGGQTPWDTGITPPEVVGFWREQALPFPGARAIDIGCGTGLNTVFLAQQGLCAFGVDLSGHALGMARQRVAKQGMAKQGMARQGVAKQGTASEEWAGPTGQEGKAFFIQADVCSLPVGGLEAFYALDIGCFHSLPDCLRAQYVGGVRRVLRAGGYFHLYAFERNPADSPGGRGLDEGEVDARFARDFTIVEEDVGVASNNSQRRTRWYLLQKL